IRNEMELGRYPEPDPAEAERMLAEFRRTHYRTAAAYEAALKAYGITEADLKAHLRWQLAAMRFTDIRFRSGLPPASSGEAEKRPTHPPPRAPGATNPADRQVRNTVAPAVLPPADKTAGATVDEQMAAWLKDARSRTRVDFKKEAFQ